MITVAETAAHKINEFITKRGKGIGIRLGIKTTGCSGLAYVLEYVDVKQDTDIVFTSNNINIYIDPKSLPYLSDLEINWKKQGLNEGFEFNNPLEKSRCGCGESFSI